MDEAAPRTGRLRSLEVIALTRDDAEELSDLLSGSSEDRTEFFTPFTFDEASLARRLAAADEDRYWGLRVDGRLAGFFMLRGWDEGFEIPAYGVFVGEEHGGSGLGRFTLDWCRAWCRLNGIPRIFLKVHKENGVAEELYRSYGFERRGASEDGRDWKYYLEL